MCGIVGWVGFDDDLTRQREVVQAMTDTMACRGPDDEGIWLHTHAALGHRRLAVIDIEGGRQPMTVDEDGTTLAALTYSGEAYNFTELRDELIARGHRFRTRSDTEVVLRGYLEWGEGIADRLNGMYAMAIWDARAQRLLLLRDRMGIKPLYYYPTSDGVLFGSEPKAILAHPRAEPVVDAEGLRELFSFAKTPEHAVFKGVKEVRPGQLVWIDHQGVHPRRYWSLTAREHTDDLDTTVAHVRGLLDDIIVRQLISDVPLCTLLSGGLDSSAITALAAGSLGSEAVHSFAVDFAGYEENFTADAMRDTPDRPYVHELAEHVKARHQDIVLNPDDLIDPHARSAVLAARDLPLGLGDGDTSLYLLFKAIRQHSTVALSGESADEVFGGYRWFHDADAVGADTFPWLAMIARASGSRPGALPLQPGLLERLDLHTYIQQRYREALEEVPRLPGETGHERRMREVCYLHLTRFVQVLLDRKDRMSMAVGLEVRVPFCDHRLVEYVFNTPWSMKTFDGREKSLLRAATKDVLPRSIAERVKSPYPATQDPEYDRAVGRELSRMLERADAPALELLDTGRLRTLADPDALDRHDPWRRRGLEMALQFNAWLEDRGVRLEL